MILASRANSALLAALVSWKNGRTGLRLEDSDVEEADIEALARYDGEILRSQKKNLWNFDEF